MMQDAIGPANVVWDVKQEVVQATYRRFDARDELYVTKAAG